MVISISVCFDLDNNFGFKLIRNPLVLKDFLTVGNRNFECTDMKRHVMHHLAVDVPI